MAIQTPDLNFLRTAPPLVPTHPSGISVAVFLVDAKTGNYVLCN
jgi:hypothetical protein